MPRRFIDGNQRIVESKKTVSIRYGWNFIFGDHLYPFTIELLGTLKETGRKYLFMTNNSSKSVEDYIKKLAKLGIPSTRDDFITSSQATAYYLKENLPGKKLYVCGTKSLKKELEMEGFTVTEDVNETEVIVMGFDTELTFQKLHDVSFMLLTRGDLPYIATNPDYVYPTEFGSVPDCSSVCDMIYNATKKRPVVIGKPSPLMPILAVGFFQRRIRRGGGSDLHRCEVRHQCRYHRYFGYEWRN
ncbi:MAG: haloacid dehalogenase [Eubacteriales bacterium]|nr:haloacid dehalogenase [Eubacteriales bacterium]